MCLNRYIFMLIMWCLFYYPINFTKCYLMHLQKMYIKYLTCFFEINCRRKKMKLTNHWIKNPFSMHNWTCCNKKFRMNIKIIFSFFKEMMCRNVLLNVLNAFRSSVFQRSSVHVFIYTLNCFLIFFNITTRVRVCIIILYKAT